MSEQQPPEPPSEPPAARQEEFPSEGSVTGVQALYDRLGGVLIPAAAAFLAFLIGGIVVLITEKSIAAPFQAYQAIFQGTGLTWFIPFVGDTAQEARDLQQTLLITTPLILTGIAVAFAFRCGMFNIGGQGQYWVGLLTAIWVGTSLDGMPRPLHIVIALAAAIFAGAIWGGIAGLLKATTGAHEVISTIMLNWIALWVGKWLLEAPDGFLQGTDPALPRSSDVLASAQLPQIWGRLQPLHAGIFIALFALVVYHLLLNRTTLGYEVRAVGFNPDAAAYGGINVKRSYFLALAIAGSFAGLAGAVDLLGWKYRLTSTEFDANLLGFVGIAVALLGRNKAVGILLAALLFGALEVGTSPRQLDPSIFNPELATNLATMIQALIIAFVGAEFLILSIWGARKRIGFPGVGSRVKPELRA
ncbi:MAG TPA: ABC transporter permease [Gaiellaceae bacterium]|nr:ABC transporter permease [Gaiellaceae bacterium]